MNYLSKKFLVSIIIPTYNCSKYIIEAIESVFSQSYQNLEIIVIDDGSTDDTKTIIEPYLNRIYYFYQENQGASKARNLGIEKAKGELIAFLDADDFFLLPTKLSEQVTYFETEPYLGIVHSGWQIVDENGNKIKDKKPWQDFPNMNLDIWLLNGPPALPSGMMFSRDWLLKIGGFDNSLRQFEDCDLILRLMLKGCKAVWLKKVTLAYRQHSNNTTLKTQQRAECVEKVLDQFFNLPDVPLEIHQLKNKVYEHKYTWLAWTFYNVGNLEQMGNYFNKALSNSDYSLTSKISIWLNFLEVTSKEENKEFNRTHLIISQEWQQLIKNLLKQETRQYLAKKQKINITPKY
ncbi:glycosyltransferase [Geminocystis sp. NIES-3709]|uniref:glycosyltransferase family 2 protein n=1 Tax=Geminocystis sp. NIES-3709 TaxID=1617448 RepID=UPI0005FCBE29|nr:glycosyltransferase [Geminocystis sp. NIES-3709]BAQ64668.1 beta-1,3-glucosyltransferase [Geminocystis sp. NIES-3709]